MTEVAVLIGSANDRKLVTESDMMGVFAAAGLTVPVHVISCHRNAEELDRFCRESTVDVFIAAAGLAAALPGALSASTKMRRVVIGVPLDDYGIDTCIRLPAGVPVLTAPAWAAPASATPPSPRVRSSPFTIQTWPQSWPPISTPRRSRRSSMCLWKPVSAVTGARDLGRT